MPNKAQLQFPGIVAARTWTRSHPGETRERGRRYPKTEVCCHCFKAFTPKGIAQHRARCRSRPGSTGP